MSDDHGDDDTMPDGASDTPRERPIDIASARAAMRKRELIDRNMRLAFEESLDEPLSPELQALVDKLADQEKSQ